VTPNEHGAATQGESRRAGENPTLSNGQPAAASARFILPLANGNQPEPMPPVAVTKPRPTFDDAWNKTVDVAKTLPEPERVALINQFINRRITYRDDASNWGLSDFWATPTTLFAKGAGDCEDFAIAKYVALRQSGMSADNLRLLKGSLRRDDITGGANEEHVVLAYYAAPGAEPLVLDCAVQTLEPLSQRHDLSVGYGFNENQIFAEGINPKSLALIKGWPEMVDRLRAEGQLP